MKKLIILITTIVFSTQWSIAQTASDTLEHSLLWEITGNGLDEPSYLYGTIHIIGEEDFFLTAATQDAFRKSEQLTLEIDMDDMQNPLKVLFSMWRNMSMDGGVTLKDLYSKEDYKIVHQYLQDSMGFAGMPPFLVNKFESVKPMFLSEMVGMDLESAESGEGMAGTTSYEMEFAEMAKQQDIEVKGLETMAYQMSIFDSIPYKEQAQMLLDAIQSGDEGQEELDILTQIYVSQNLNAMDAMMNGDGTWGNYMDVLLINRNKNWIPKIGKMARKKPTFFAVGAGHLPGQEGVIKLLRKEGYTVKPLF